MSQLIEQAQLSVQRALVGEITSEIRAVTVEVNVRQITVRVYHDGIASDELWGDLDASMAEVYADFPGEGLQAVSVNLKLLRCDGSEPLPVIGIPLFARKGTGFRKWTPSDVW